MQPLIERIKVMPMEEQDGSINYAFTRIMMSIYPRRYFHYNRAMGVLNCIAQEFYRVIVGPYEGTKIKENGEVKTRP